MKRQQFIAFVLSIIALIIFTPEVLAKEPSIIWQQKLTNKSMVLDGVTTSKNETLLVSYTTKNSVKTYQLFKVNNKTAKVKNLSKLKDGEVQLFDFKGNAYIVHREKRKLTIYDESFKAVYKKTWKTSLRFSTFPIRKSEVDSNLIALGENVYNFGTKKYEPFYIFLKTNSKGKLVEVAASKLPGESYYLSRPDAPVVKQMTLIGTDTKFSLKLDTKTIPNYKKGFRSSFSSLAMTKYKNHYYFILRENTQGDGEERLLKMNSKGKVVSHIVLPGSVVSSPEPIFVGNQVLFMSINQNSASYSTVNLDSMKVTTTAAEEIYFAKVKKDLYYLYTNNKYQYFNGTGKLLYTLPTAIFASKNEKYGISILGNYASATVYDLKKGTLLASLKTGNVVSFDDKLLAVEKKSSTQQQVKLYKLK